MNFIENESVQKLRGGYYTPFEIASFICKWTFENKIINRVLEPSCGDGIFIEAISSFHKREVEVTGFEIDPYEAAKARKRGNGAYLKKSIYNEDFLAWSLRNQSQFEKFDAVVGNPPFIRYQYLPEEAQILAERIFKLFSIKFTKHTNAWVPFVIASLALLRPGGRLGMVLPSEILHIIHAQAVRSFLGHHCRNILIFDPQELWFEKTLQGVIILLAEKKLNNAEINKGLKIIPIRGKDFLNDSPSKYTKGVQFVNGKTIDGKWMRALLPADKVKLFDEVSANKSVYSFKEIADVDVGLVTGANQFFLVQDKVVDSYELKNWAHPMFGRSEHCPGIIYDHKQHYYNSKNGFPTNFLWFNEKDDLELNTGAKKYIKYGETLGLNNRYKCRIREPWYKVPSVYSTEIGMLKRAHDIPRLILNRLKAYTTDTAYRIRPRAFKSEKLVCCFINTLTALSAELEGRHYGGGVLELVPSEIENLKIPVPNLEIEIDKLDKLIKTQTIEEVLEYQDKKIFKALGYTSQERDVIFSAWVFLRNRRQRNN